MSINKQALSIVNATEEDFLKWCKRNKKPNYKPSSKEDFINKILKKELVKDEKTGEWIEKGEEFLKTNPEKKGWKVWKK